MYKICLYVPESHAKQVKEAMFAAGAGRIGNYAKCSWQVKGEGQFTPLEGSNPFSGEANQPSCEREYKIEMVCTKPYIQAAIAALKTSHPYETPAYHVLACEDL